MQHLLQVLKNGYWYDAVQEDGSTKRVDVTPNRYMISAARTIEHLLTLQQNSMNELSICRTQIDELFNELKRANNNVETLTKND